jgi:hypothetical protein
MKKPVMIGVVIAVVAVLAIGGRMVSQMAGNKIAEKVIESQTGAKVNIDSNSNGANMTIKTTGGQVQYSVGGDVNLPVGFPKELIAENDAKLVMSTSAESGVSVAYTTNAAVGEVFEKYMTDLTAAGWKKDSEVSTDQAKMLTFSKASEGVYITIGNNSSGDNTAKTSVSVVWGKK